MVSDSVSTTFRHAKPAEERRTTNGHGEATGLLHPEETEGFDVDKDVKPDWNLADPQRHVYSRYSQPTLTRAEKVLSALTVSEKR